MNNILNVENLKKYYSIRGGLLFREQAKVYAVDDVSFSVKKGETLGLVGESGCGKSTLGKTVMRLYDANSGKIEFLGKNMIEASKDEIRSLRREMQMIFQDPSESLNQSHTIRTILEEPFIIHKIGTPSERSEMVKDLIRTVELPESSLDKFPHEFSGGQKQRIGIARAIALNPKLIVCDEPVSALDVSIQSQIINLLLKLQRERQLSYLFIAHDLSVVKHISDRVAVMYLGKIVEVASSEKIYEKPNHPYTQALISAIPRPTPGQDDSEIILEGDVPSPRNPPSGCRFHTRCPYAEDICKNSIPELKEISENHFSACHFSEKFL